MSRRRSSNPGRLIPAIIRLLHERPQLRGLTTATQLDEAIRWGV